MTLFSFSLVQAVWWNPSYDYRYKIISNSTTEFPVSVNDTYGICGNIIWALIGNNSHLYCKVQGCCSGEIAIANETHEKYWENEADHTGNNPIAVWRNTLEGEVGEHYSVYHMNELDVIDSTNQYSATAYNKDPSDIVSGVFGDAIEFDRTGDAYLDTGNTEWGHKIVKNHSHSIWIKSQDTSNYMATFGGSDTVIGYLLEYVGWNSPSQHDVYFYVRSSGPTLLSGYAAPNWYDGQWHHFVFVMIPVDNTIKIYMDNVSQPITYVSIPTLQVGWDYTDPHAIGAYDYGTIEGEFNGSIDEYRMFNRTLSEEEIEIMYLNGVNQLTTLGEEETRLPPTTTTTQYNYTALEERVEELESRTSTLESIMTTVQDNIATMQTTIGTIQAQIVGILSEITNIWSEIDSIWSTVNLMTTTTTTTTTTSTTTTTTVPPCKPRGPKCNCNGVCDPTETIYTCPWDCP